MKASFRAKLNEVPFSESYPLIKGKNMEKSSRLETPRISPGSSVSGVTELKKMSARLGLSLVKFYN